MYIDKSIISLKSYKLRKYSNISFNKIELGQILGIYGKMVSMGLWKDYGISCQPNSAVFAIYRHTAELPFFRIIKKTSKRKRDNFLLVAIDGKILKSSEYLYKILMFFDDKNIKLVCN